MATPCQTEPGIAWKTRRAFPFRGGHWPLGSPRTSAAVPWLASPLSHGFPSRGWWGLIRNSWGRCMRALRRSGTLLGVLRSVCVNGTRFWEATAFGIRQLTGLTLGVAWYAYQEWTTATMQVWPTRIGLVLCFNTPQIFFLRCAGADNPGIYLSFAFRSRR